MEKDAKSGLRIRGNSCFELLRVVDILFGIGARRGHPACGVEFFCSGRLVFLKIGVSTGPLRVQVCIANADRLLYVVHPCNRRFDPLTRRRRPKPAGNGRFSFTRLHPLWDAHISSRLLAVSTLRLLLQSFQGTVRSLPAHSETHRSSSLADQFSSEL